MSKKHKRQGWSETEINDCGYTPLALKHVQDVANCIELQIKLGKKTGGAFPRESRPVGKPNGWLSADNYRLKLSQQVLSLFGI